MTGCEGSRTRGRPPLNIDRNLGITAPVLSCVITCFGGIGVSIAAPPEMWNNARMSAPTEFLYETDSYLRDLEARVIAQEGQNVALDRTAFYPGGGGQPCDKGALIHGGVVLAVTEVRRDGG